MIDQEPTSAPDLSQLHSRPANSADVDWLVALRISTMADYLRASGETLSTAEQRARVMHQFENIEILMLGETAVGMSKIVRGPSPWKLVQIQCLPPHQRHGIGTRVIRNLLEEAAVAGCAVELSVLRVNPARALYERLGFRVIEEKAASFTMRADPG